MDNKETLNVDSHNNSNLATDQSSDPADPFASRSHRTWTPKYGRVQKCDFCNARSPGTLHVCTTCAIHICEKCSRSDRWHSDSKHFIDPDAYNWIEVKSSKASSSRKTRASGGSSAVGDGIARSGEQHRNAEVKNHDETDPDDTEYIDDDNSSENSSTASKRPRSFVNFSRPFRGGNTRQQSTYPYPPRTTAAAARPSVRQAAARALTRMSRQNGSDDGDGEGDEGDDDNSGDNNTNNNGNNTGDNSGEDDSNNIEQQGADGNHGSVPTRHPVPPSGFPLADQPVAPTPYDNLVYDIYEQIYGIRPVWMPRVRTSIPSRWDGEWPSSTPSPGQHRREEDGTIYQQYELYHQHAFSAATQFYPLNNLLPAPRGYEQYSFENYPPRIQEGYTATVRTTPRFHPYNELSPAEIALVEADRLTLTQMRAAWHDNNQLAAMRNQGRHLAAIQLLWHVFELRRTRVDVRAFSQTVRFFVAERDRAVQMEQAVEELDRVRVESLEQEFQRERRQEQFRRYQHGLLTAAMRNGFRGTPAQMAQLLQQHLQQLQNQQGGSAATNTGGSGDTAGNNGVTGAEARHSEMIEQLEELLHRRG